MRVEMEEVFLQSHSGQLRRHLAIKAGQWD